MLKFVTGRSGSGKTTCIYNTIKEKISAGNKKIILLVPEQSSFENEKKMLELLGARDFAKIKVLSFSRIYDFVSEALKISPISPSKNITQIIIMSAAIERVRKHLKLYKKSPGGETAKLMLSAIKELKSNKIDNEKLSVIYEKSKKKIIKQKITELELISKEYKALTANTVADSEDALSALEKIIKANTVFYGYDIFLDEFSGFTPQQLSIIEIILRQAKNVYITFCRENNEICNKIHSLFYCTENTMNKIIRMAQNQGIPLDSTAKINGSARFKNPELTILEKNIFKSNKLTVSHTPKNIAVYRAADLNDECENIARNIRKHIIKNNYLYKDFAVITRNPEAYSAPLKSAFAKYEIPFFSDNSEQMFDTNLSAFIFAAFDIIHYHGRASDILRYLKTGLTDLLDDDVLEIENYILMWNIKSGDWSEDFTLNPQGLGKEIKEKDLKVLEHLNKLRKIIITPLQKFKKNICSASATQISAAIYNLMVDANVPENLRNFCHTLSAAGRTNAAQQEASLWDTIIQIIDEMARLPYNSSISSKKYADILKSAFEATKISSIPQSVDAVTVGAAERARLCAPKIVFIVGAANGEFPLTPSSSSLFTEQEVSYMSSIGADIRDSCETLIAKEKFLAYTAIAGASEKLYVSWPVWDLKENGNLPSEIIKEIKAIFPKITINDRASLSCDDMLWSRKAAFEACCINYGNNSERSQAIKYYFEHDDSYKKKYEFIQNTYKPPELCFNNKNISKNLFGTSLKLSASQIEKYYSCRFKYFCEYGLKAKPLKPASFGNLEYGSLVHFVLEKFFKKHSADSIKTLSDADLLSEVTILSDSYIKKFLGGWQNKPERFAYVISRFKKSFIMILRHIQKEFLESKFKIAELEAEISDKSDIHALKIDLPNNGSVKIEGKVDRIDTMKTEKGTYIRIIDYKTGTKSFRLCDVINGLNMQMLIYLMAILENGKRKYGNIIPAGVLYYTAFKPLIDAAHSETAEKSKLIKQMRMNGLILKEKSVIEGMESDGKGVFIPACIKNGEIKESDNLISHEEFGSIWAHIKRLIVNMAQNLILGEIAPSPVKNQNRTSCDLCEYFAVCRYNKNVFKDLSGNMKNEDVFKKINQKESAFDGK